jgi:hypothetical protein
MSLAIGFIGGLFFSILFPQPAAYVRGLCAAAWKKVEDVFTSIKPPEAK